MCTNGCMLKIQSGKFELCGNCCPVKKLVVLAIICPNMSADEDDDYLSDKFLVAAPSPTTKASSYSQLRKEAQKKAHLKNELNKQKSRRQRETEAREEGLSKSLFERAKEEDASGSGSANKALSIMMKMGFKPGQALGTVNDADDLRESTGARTTVDDPKNTEVTSASDEQTQLTISSPGDDSALSSKAPGTRTQHKTEPLPLNEWEGRKGIGLGKRRARSPSAAERLAKMAKMAENMEQRDFRQRARDEYNNRRAEGRLVPAQLTCTTMDEKAGRPFNVLWLNPNNSNTFPPGLVEALALHGNLSIGLQRQGDSVQSRLREQMQNDALVPINDDGDLADEGNDVMKTSLAGEDQYSSDLLEEVAQFLRLQAQDRLHLVLSYLRDQHRYCFWCGVEYGSEDEMNDQCPGPEEEDHD